MDFALHRAAEAHIAIDMKLSDQAVARTQGDSAAPAGRRGF
jgi:hypothetical protein